MKLIGLGRTAEIFEYEQDKIIKLYRQDFPQDAIHHELRTSQLVHSLGIDTPQAFEIVSVNRRQGIIYQRIHGATLLSRMTRSPWAVHQQSRTLAALHYEVHSRPASGALRQQKQVLTDRIKAASFLAEEEKVKIIHYLQQLPDGDMLCHGDFHPDNVLVGDKNWIIDWMTGMSGSPAGDVARSIILFSFGTLPEGTPKVVKSIIGMLRSRLKSAYIKQYLRLSGLPYSEIERWLMPVAAARLVEWLPDEEKEQLVKLVRQRLSALS